MGEFKPMVKMETTEPSVILKLKKGGSATHKRMHAEGAKEGLKPVKKMDGGMMGSMAGSPALPMGNPVAARAMAAKRMAAKPTPPTRGLPAPSRPAMPAAMPMGRPMMKKGGGVQAELDMHESKPASKAHKGLKTGGVVKGQAGFKTGGVVKGQAGFKDGGMPMKDGKPAFIGDGKGLKHGGKAMMGGGGMHMMPDGGMMKNSAMKKGGASKKRFATGGTVNNSGHAVAMPKKAPSGPVATTGSAGTFKKGGLAC